MTDPTGAIDDRAWSPLPPELATNEDAKKARATAIAETLVAEDKDGRGVDAARAKAAADLNQKLVDTLTTVTTGGIDRARAGAQFVQTAATAIAGLYTGVLGVLFVADQAAPSRAFIPTLFLGSAVVLATVYLAFVVPGKGMWPPMYDAIPDKDMWTRLNYVTTWVRSIVFPKAGALRAAVVCLFFGLAFLPVGIAKLPPELTVPLFPIPEASTPAAIDWPAPTVLPDPSLSAVLYTAQLEEFRENLPPIASGKPDTTARDNAIAWSLALIAFLLVGLVAWNPFGWWKPLETAQVYGPETIDRGRDDPSTLKAVWARIRKTPTRQPSTRVGKYVIKRAADSQYYFVLEAANGATIATSERYPAKASTTAGIEAVRRNASSMLIDDRTDVG